MRPERIEYYSNILSAQIQKTRDRIARDEHARNEAEGKMQSRYDTQKENFNMDVNMGYSILASQEALLAEIQAAEPQTTVHPGAECVIEIEGEEERILFMRNSGKLDDLFVITPDSPIGQAIMGSVPGEEVTYSLGNRIMHVIVKNIQ